MNKPYLYTNSIQHSSFSLSQFGTGTVPNKICTAINTQRRGFARRHHKFQNQPAISTLRSRADRNIRNILDGPSPAHHRPPLAQEPWPASKIDVYPEISTRPRRCRFSRPGPGINHGSHYYLMPLLRPWVGGSLIRGPHLMESFRPGLVYRRPPGFDETICLRCRITDPEEMKIEIFRVCVCQKGRVCRMRFSAGG